MSFLRSHSAVPTVIRPSSPFAMLRHTQYNQFSFSKTFQTWRQNVFDLIEERRKNEIAQSFANQKRLVKVFLRIFLKIYYARSFISSFQIVGTLKQLYLSIVDIAQGSSLRWNVTASVSVMALVIL